MNKAIIITGGNSGLGFETARRVAGKDKGYSVILACRSLEKGDASAKRLAEETGGDVSAMRLDLASLASVRKFAGQVRERSLTVCGLDNNAGISGVQAGALTGDGFDVVFQSNHLGHFLLTNLLLPLMAEDARILNISSDMHNPPYGELTWRGTEALAHPDAELSGDRSRYFYSKLCNLYFTYELDRRLRARGSRIACNALNPGFMGDTNLGQGTMTRERIEEIRRTMPERYGDLSVSSSAAASLLTEPDLAGVSGKYYSLGLNETRSSELSYSLENARELWDTSVRLSNL